MASKGERIDGLDALRGFAIFGILLINIQVFSGWGFVSADTRQALTWSEWDEPIATWLDILVRAKFYSLFSLLFGYSFMMLAQRYSKAPSAITCGECWGCWLLAPPILCSYPRGTSSCCTG